MHEGEQSYGERTFLDEMDDWSREANGCSLDDFAKLLPKTDEEGRFRERRGLTWVRGLTDKPIDFRPGTHEHDIESETRIRTAVLIDRGAPKETSTTFMRRNLSVGHDDRPSLIHARAWWNKKVTTKEHRHCMISGARGVGKTYAAIWCMSQVAPVEVGHDNPATVRFISAPDLADIVYDRMTQERMLRFDALLQLTFLVVDDLGTEPLNDRVLGKFYQLVNGRHEQGLRTLYTSQLDKVDFEKRYPNGIADRIFGGGLCKHFKGESLR